MAPIRGPTSGATWRALRVQGVPVELPSGNLVLLRPVSPLRLAAQGELFDILTPVVNKMLFGSRDEQLSLIRKTAGALDEGQDDDIERMKRSIKDMTYIERVYNAVCVAAFVSPRIVADPQADDEISIDDIDVVDKVHVYTMSLRGAAYLELFRYESPPDVEIIPNGESDGEPAIGPDDDSGPMGSAPV